MTSSTENTNSGADQKGFTNPAAKALKKKNPFTDGSFDGTTKIQENAGYNPYDNPNKGQINIIDGEEFEVPANAKIEIPDPENPDKIIEVDNTSRGVIGYVSNPEKIAELKAQGIPVNDNAPKSPSVAELQAKYDEQKADKARQARIREQKAIRNRLLIQGADYTPPDDLKDVPGLEPTGQQYQNVEPKANEELGEVILDNNNISEIDSIQGHHSPEHGPAAADAAATTTANQQQQQQQQGQGQGTGLENQQANVRANQNEGMGASSTGIQGDAAKDKEGKQTLTNPDLNPQTGLPNPPKNKSKQQQEQELQEQQSQQHL